MKPSCFLLILTVCTQTLTSRKELTQTNFPKISGQKKRPDKELIQLLEINLTRNDFEFNGDFYLQVKGTAMGKKFAPAYANIFMAEWESEALSKCVKKPLYYYRFLDDIWGIWHHSEQDFEGFLNTLNGHNASKLKSTFHKTKIDFLDTTTFKGPNFLTDHRLDVKVFFKPTDTHALLFKTSFHPKHTFAGLIKSQLLRFHRICTQQCDFKQATRILFAALATRGYSRSFLRKCLKSFLITKPIDVSPPMLPVWVTCSPASCKLVGTIRTHFQNLLQRNQILTDHRIIAAFRRNRNLGDFLIKAKVPPLSEPKSRDQGKQFFFTTRSGYRVSLSPSL